MSKTTSKSATPPPRNVPAAAHETGPEGRPLSAQQLLEIRSRWRAPTAVDVAAYRSQFTDEECAEAGTLTKAINVRNDAGGWILTIHQVISSPLGAQIPYPGHRLIYFLDLYELLDARIAEQDAQQGGVRGAKATAADHEQAAAEINENLYEILDGVAGSRKKERRELDEAAIPVTKPEDLVTRLSKLVKLGTAWLGTTDAELSALVSDAQLTQSILDAAGRAADALEAARRGARSVRIVTNDIPAVNVIEGRVTREMRHVKRIFDRVRKKVKGVPALIPSAGTRAAIVGRTKPAKGKPAQEGGVPDGTTPAKAGKKGG